MQPRFEDLEATMDAQVEDRLGDSISYSRGGASPTIVRGFINLDADEESPDPVRQRWIVTINRERLPSPPTATDRLTHSKLPGIFRPSAGTIGTDGRDYVFRIQKA